MLIGFSRRVSLFAFAIRHVELAAFCGPLAPRYAFFAPAKCEQNFHASPEQLIDNYNTENYQDAVGESVRRNCSHNKHLFVGR